MKAWTFLSLLLFILGAGCLVETDEDADDPQVLTGLLDLDMDGNADFAIGPVLFGAPEGGVSHVKHLANGTGENVFAGKVHAIVGRRDTVIMPGSPAPLDAGVFIGPIMGDSIRWRSNSQLEIERFTAPEGQYLAFRMADGDSSANRISEETIRYGWMRISVDTSAEVEWGDYPVLLHDFSVAPPGVTLRTGEELQP